MGADPAARTDLRSGAMALPAPTAPPSPLTRLRRRLHRFVVLRRPWLVAALVGLAVLSGLRAVAPPAPATEPVVVAAHDLEGGETLGSEDLVVRRWSPGTVPRGITSRTADLVGRTLASPLRAGEPVSDRRVVAPGLLAGYPGLEAVPVRVAEADVAPLLRVGDTVDVVAVGGSGRAWTAARDARVLALPRAEDEATAGLSGDLSGAVGGAVVLLGVPADVALRLVSAGSSGPLTLTWSD